MAIIVTEPYSDYRKGSNGAVIVREVSGVSTANAAQAASGLGKNSVHPEDQNFICDNWDAQKLSPDFFRLTFSFSPKDFGDPNNPLAAPMRIHWDIGLTSEPVDRDVDGNPILNSGFDPFDPPTLADFPELYLNVTRYEPAPFNVARALSFIRTVNQGSITIGGAMFTDGQCYLRRYAPTTEYTLDARAIEVGYEFCMREQGWDTRLLDQGLRGWNTRNNATTEMFHPAEPNAPTPTTAPTQISSAVRLNGKGKPLDTSLVTAGGDTLDQRPSSPKGATIEKSPDGSAVFLIYKRYKRSKFQLLGL